MSLPDINWDSSEDESDDVLRRPQAFLACGRSRFQCLVCPSPEIMGLQKAVRHEDTEIHVRNVRKFDNTPPSTDPIASMMAPTPSSGDHDFRGQAAPGNAHEPDAPLSPPHPVSTGNHGSQHLNAADVAGDLVLPENIAIHGPALASDPPNQLFDDYSSLFGAVAQEPITEAPPRMRSAWWARTAQAGGSEDDDEIDLFDALSSVGSSDGMTQEEADDSDTDDSLCNGNVRESSEDLLEHAPSDGVHLVDDDEWWPWKSQKECLTDLLSAFPRAVFSESELEITRWYASKLGVKKLPKMHALKQRQTRILELAGTEPRLVDGSLGHLYSVASLSKIIADEMANPKVRKHLHFLPADNNNGHSEARHGARWRHEVNANIAGPMARGENDQDYYVEEPAVANIDDFGTLGPVWPTRWFERDGKTFAMVHTLRVNREVSCYTIDPSECRELPLHAFVLNYPKLATVHAFHGLPHPSNVKASKVTLPNPWRTKANGLRVKSLPLWLYCDDTSGNVSKKWNKHNSFLFILAGLLQEQTLKPYNIHFLSTSNLASPLEMLEAIAADLRTLQTDGLRVWDCEHNDYVLIIPWILAFLGDNPMQSELASHIGLNGKFFCRVCKVLGKAKERPTGTAGEIDRVCDFMKAGTPREVKDTLDIVAAQIDDIMAGIPSRVDPASTKSGIKDRHFVPLFEELSATCTSVQENNKKLGKKDTNEGLLDALKKVVGDRTPADIMNPIYKIRELDPHADTPVEILHVVLLGIIKYFWRDAVSRQNSVDRKILRTRLKSLDVSALGLSRLQGDTLVNYAGSLTGRDFRIVLQVAPAVLYGLLPEPAYEAWLALSRLAPLIFQPKIKDVDEYVTRLQIAIDNFLGATALWSIQWFNKPKFHILLHSPKHIRRFGPAILTATEGFESYNLVIRLRSVHSNRHAPSVDISTSMSFMHAARHLVSGGLVWESESACLPRAAGRSVRNLLKDAVFSKLMNMPDFDIETGSHSRTRTAQSVTMPFEKTLTAATHLHCPSPAVQDGSLLVTVSPKLKLVDGDVAHKDHFVVFKSTTGSLDLGRIKEILSVKSHPYGFLLERWYIGEEVLPYRLPGISPMAEQLFVTYDRVKCCIHAFHNCKRQACKTSRTRVLVQERQATDKRDLEYRHENEPDDLILNLAQFRSAMIMQELRTPPNFPLQYTMDSGSVPSMVQSANHDEDGSISPRVLRDLVEVAVKAYEAQKEMPPPQQAMAGTRKRKSTGSSMRGAKRGQPSQPTSHSTQVSSRGAAMPVTIPASPVTVTASSIMVAASPTSTYATMASVYTTGHGQAYRHPTRQLAASPAPAYATIMNAYTTGHGQGYEYPSMQFVASPVPAYRNIASTDTSGHGRGHDNPSVHFAASPAPGYGNIGSGHTSSRGHGYEHPTIPQAPSFIVPANEPHLAYHHDPGDALYHSQNLPSPSLNYLHPQGNLGTPSYQYIPWTPEQMPSTPVFHQTAPRATPSTPSTSRVIQYPVANWTYTDTPYSLGGSTYFGSTPSAMQQPPASPVSVHDGLVSEYPEAGNAMYFDPQLRTDFQPPQQPLYYPPPQRPN